MGKFLLQLTALEHEEPAMKRAVKNVIMDIQSDQQPKGNIKTHIVEAIENICSKHPGKKTGHLRKTITNHQSIKNAEFYDPVPPPKGKPLQRVVSFFNFVKYHILDGSRGKTLIGRSYSKQDALLFLKKDILSRFEKRKSIKIELDELQGSTGKEDEPTWWTFYEKDSVIPGTGKTYMQELALTDEEMQEAEMDNTTIQLTVTAEELGRDLFKPTALDSFFPETKFEPELTGNVYGYTSPQESGLRPRPEIVSASAAYRDLKNTKSLKLKRFPYKIEQ